MHVSKSTFNNAIQSKMSRNGRNFNVHYYYRSMLVPNLLGRNNIKARQLKIRKKCIEIINAALNKVKK